MFAFSIDLRYCSILSTVVKISTMTLVKALFIIIFLYETELQAMYLSSVSLFDVSPTPKGF